MLEVQIFKLKYTHKSCIYIWFQGEMDTIYSCWRSRHAVRFSGETDLRLWAEIIDRYGPLIHVSCFRTLCASTFLWPLWVFFSLYPSLELLFCNEQLSMSTMINWISLCITYLESLGTAFVRWSLAHDLSWTMKKKKSSLFCRKLVEVETSEHKGVVVCCSWLSRQFNILMISLVRVNL